MKTTKCLYIAISLFVAMTFLLSACGPAATTAAPAEATKPPVPTATTAAVVEPTAAPTNTEAPAPTEPPKTSWKDRPTIQSSYQGELVLWDWSFEPRNKWMTKYIAEWEKLHPGVTIKYEVMPEGDVGSKLATAVVAGTGPDFSVVNEEWRVEYERNGLLAPLPKDVFPQEWRDLLLSTPSLTQPDGEIYVTSLGAMGGELYYDKKYFTDNGLTEADLPKTWDEVVTLAQKMAKWNADGTLDIAGFGINGLPEWLWFDLVAQKGGHFYDEGVTKTLWNEKAGVEAAQFIADLYIKNKLTSSKVAWWGELYCNGKAPMGYAYAWFPGWVGATCPDRAADLGVAPLPVFAGSKLQGIQLEEDFLAVFKATAPEKQALIWDFIHFLLLEDDARVLEIAEAFMVPPDRKDLLEDPIVQKVDLLRIGAAVAPISMRPGPLPMFGDHMKFLNTAFQEILLTEGDVQKAMDTAVEQANLDLQSSGKKYTSTEYK